MEQISEDVNFEVLRGLTNALLAAGKPDEVSYSIRNYRLTMCKVNKK